MTLVGALFIFYFMGLMPLMPVAMAAVCRSNGRAMLFLLGSFAISVGVFALFLHWSSS